MDIMMGNWVRHGCFPHPISSTEPALLAQAAANLKTLAEPELHLYQEVIDMENPDLYRWMTGQAPIPAEVRIASPAAATSRCSYQDAHSQNHFSSAEGMMDAYP